MERERQRMAKAAGQPVSEVPNPLPGWTCSLLAFDDWSPKTFGCMRCGSTCSDSRACRRLIDEQDYRIPDNWQDYYDDEELLTRK